VLHSIELNRIDCAEFVKRFDFTHLPVLNTISLTACKSLVALFHLLLPHEGKFDSEIVRPLLRVMKLNQFDAKDYDSLCEVILYRRTCDKPIEAVTVDARSMKDFPEKVEWVKQRILVEKSF
jgi:hypothetical protein